MLKKRNQRKVSLLIGKPPGRCERCSQVLPSHVSDGIVLARSHYDLVASDDHLGLHWFTT
jgi:hypothetical protein